MKITKGTIVRAAMVLALIFNQVLKAAGKSPIPIEEGTIASVVEMVLEVAIVIVAYWKNNSWSEKAIKADEFLLSLKNENETEGKR